MKRFSYIVAALLLILVVAFPAAAKPAPVCNKTHPCSTPSPTLLITPSPTIIPTPTPTIIPTPTPIITPVPTPTSTPVPSPSPDFITSEGTAIYIQAGSFTAADIDLLLKAAGNNNIIGPRVTVRVQDIYSSATSTGVSCCDSNGKYYNYNATIYLDSRSTSNFTSRPDYIATHEFGHAWTLYYLYMSQQDIWDTWLNARGLLNDPRLESSYVWSKREMIADDYRLLFGNDAAKIGVYINPEVADPRTITGFADWFTTVWAAP